MASNYKKLGEFLRLTDERNSDLSITNLQGVSISKQFIPSIANIIGTDLSSYKIVRKGQFAYGPVTSRNGDKVSIALLESDDCIISSSYLSFEVVDKTKLDPKYLMLWFMRPEFDRYARFMSNGSAREIFDWECMCGVELPVPSIEEQRKIVHDYKVITDRIELLKKINENIDNQGKELFDKLEKNDEWSYLKIADVITLLKDGTHNPPERIEKGVPLIAGQTLENGFINYEKMTYISNDDYLNIHSRYKPEVNDLILTKIGTVGKVGILRKKDIPIAIHCNSALIRFDSSIISNYWGFWMLNGSSFQNGLNEHMTSSVQDFLSLGEIGEIKIKVPPKFEMVKYDCFFKKMLDNKSVIIDEIDNLDRIRRLILLNLSKEVS